MGNVAILGDSRVFDTYYVNHQYGTSRYGYDKTFPHLLRGLQLARRRAEHDVVHIPEHFRSGTIENNIIRLALADPSAVVLCDGIWETLVNKEHFLEYASRRLREHPSASGKPVELTYSSAILAELFAGNQLSVTPTRYAARQRRLVSYFRRRRRRGLWLSLPAPPPDHMERLHFAGNHRLIPEWDQCLRAINAAVAPVVTEIGGEIVDLDALARQSGGYAKCLIDQWHFSEHFHAAIARRLDDLIAGGGPDVGASHVSHAFMLPPLERSEALVVLDLDGGGKAWLSQQREWKVSAATSSAEAAAHADGRVVVAFATEPERRDLERTLLPLLSPDAILVYPEEIGDIVNPVGDDKARFAVRANPPANESR